MQLRLAYNVILAFAVGVSRIAAQTPASPPVIPDTPASSVLRAWLDAFNSGDTARMRSYYEHYQPDRSLPTEVSFRERTGGFDVLSIERSEPRHIEFTARERGSANTAYGAIDVSPALSATATFSLVAMGPDVSSADLRIDESTRRRIIDLSIAQLEAYYVFPDVARRLGDSLRTRRARGTYDSYVNGMSFALKLTSDLRELGHDKHLWMTYNPREFFGVALQAPPAHTSMPLASPQQRADDAPCGIARADAFPGDVGYLDLRFFAEPELCGASVSAAMNRLAGAHALIVDLRNNGGGSPAMVAYLSSYLVSRRTHLNDMWTRRSGKTQQFWTRDDVPGAKFGGDKPVYVLTSARTFSAAEEFAYNLGALKRATIVGEITGGGAHPVMRHRLDDHFTLAVPVARAINPITHTNWEGVGVEPSVKVPATNALETAVRLARAATGASDR
jgi:Peptidase family S41/N-terminal domain of Peptidase_S41 in eukaryotic IRBP